MVRCIVEAVLWDIFFPHVVLLPPRVPAIHVYRSRQGAPVRMDALVRKASWGSLLARPGRGDDVLLDESKKTLVWSRFRGIGDGRIVLDDPSIHAFRA